jgi:hypothetical protein
MTADLHHERRWLILAVLGVAQLMVILDVTVVNIALPSAQDALGFSHGDRQWIVTAYTLAFGGLLLLAGRVAVLAGRVAVLAGRKRTLLIGLVGFALASALGGAAQSFGMLVAARALQGVFGALLAPSALSLLTTTFTDPAERGKAFGVFGAIGVAGGAIGLLLGGASPSTSPGAGAYTSTSPSRFRPPSAGSRCCTIRLARLTRSSTSPAPSPPFSDSSRSSAASRRPRPTAGAPKHARLHRRRPRPAHRLHRASAPRRAPAAAAAASCSTATAAAHSSPWSPTAPGSWPYSSFSPTISSRTSASRRS